MMRKVLTVIGIVLIITGVAVTVGALDSSAIVGVGEANAMTEACRDTFGQGAINTGYSEAANPPVIICETPSGERGIMDMPPDIAEANNINATAHWDQNQTA